MLTMVPPEATSSVVPLAMALVLMLEPLAMICVDTVWRPLNGGTQLYPIKATQQAQLYDVSMNEALTDQLRKQNY
jgi:hypothetical protein